MITAAELVQQKIMPVYSNAVTANNIMVLQACYDAGLRHFEFTNRNENALDEFIHLKKYADDKLPGMMLGVGTIKNSADAEIFLSAGAAYLISPLVSNELIDFTKKRNVLWIPGCGTASEVGMAENAGIGLVKIFPAAALGGPEFIKLLRGPFYNMQFMANGGISGDAVEIKKYFAAGASAVGLGNSFFTGEMNVENITQKLKILIAALEK
jgi:2-dehydro-3-deoxyphosphogluconate aldolase / (4S)-4-hydroxy-2-oxoglutarate aldolase